jgi:hypothetical protein
MLCQCFSRHTTYRVADLTNYSNSVVCHREKAERIAAEAAEAQSTATVACESDGVSSETEGSTSSFVVSDSDISEASMSR